MTNPAPQLPDWFPRDSQLTNRPHEAVPLEPLTLSAQAGVDGTATVTFGPVPGGYSWLVDYLTVTSSSAAASAVNVYDTDVANRTLLDGSTSLGNSGVAVYLPPRILRTSRSLVVQWTGATPGATCNARLELRQQRQVS